MADTLNNIEELVGKDEKLIDVWGRRNPRFEKKYEQSVLRILSDYGVGASENTGAKGKVLGAGYEPYIMAFFIGPFYDLICHTDPIGSQRKTEIFLFLLLDRAGIGDQILADLEVHQRLSAEKVNFQISAHTGIFHQKIQGALSGLE